jgi:hypothetical protein
MFDFRTFCVIFPGTQVMGGGPNQVAENTEKRQKKTGYFSGMKPVFFCRPLLAVPNLNLDSLYPFSM